MKRRLLALLCSITLSSATFIVQTPTASASLAPCNPSIDSISGSSNVWGKPSPQLNIPGPGQEISGDTMQFKNISFELATPGTTGTSVEPRPASAPSASTSTTESTPVESGNATEIAAGLSDSAALSRVNIPTGLTLPRPAGSQGINSEFPTSYAPGTFSSNATINNHDVSSINSTLLFNQANAAINQRLAIAASNATLSATNTTTHNIDSLTNLTPNDVGNLENLVFSANRHTSGVNPVGVLPSGALSFSRTPINPTDLHASQTIEIRPPGSTQPLTGSTNSQPLPYVDGHVLGISSATSFSSTETVQGGTLDVTPEMVYQANGIWTDPSGNRTQLTIIPKPRASGCTNEFEKPEGPIGGYSGSNDANHIEISGNYRFSGGQQVTLRALVAVNVVARPAGGSATADATSTSAAKLQLSVTNRCSGTNSVFELNWNQPSTGQGFNYKQVGGAVTVSSLPASSVVNPALIPFGQTSITTGAAPVGGTYSWQVEQWYQGAKQYESNIVTMTAKNCAATSAATQPVEPADTSRGGTPTTSSSTSASYTAAPGAVSLNDFTVQCSSANTATLTASWGAAANAENYVLYVKGFRGTDTTDVVPYRTLGNSQLSYQANVPVLAPPANPEADQAVYQIYISAINKSGLSQQAIKRVPAPDCAQLTTPKAAPVATAIPSPVEAPSPTTPTVTPTPTTAPVVTAPAAAPFTFTATASCIDRVPTATLTWETSTNANSFTTLQITPVAVTYAKDIPTTTTSQKIKMISPVGAEEQYAVLAIDQAGTTTPGLQSLERTDVTIIKATTPDCNPTPSPFTGSIQLTCTNTGSYTGSLNWSHSADANDYIVYDDNAATGPTVMTTTSGTNQTLPITFFSPGQSKLNFHVEAINDRGHAITQIFASSDDGSIPICTPPIPVATTVTPPVAANTNVSAATNTPATIDLIKSTLDLDNNLDPTTLAVTKQPTNGTVTLTPDHKAAYTPKPGFTGTDTFNSQICDTTKNCATATTTITVQAPSTTNQTPTTTPASPQTTSAFFLSVAKTCAGNSPQHILTWTAADNATSYTVKRDKDILNADNKTTNFVDTSPIASNSYTYSIEAKTEAGVVASNSIQITTDACNITQTPSTTTTLNGQSQSTPSTSTTNTPAPVSTPAFTQQTAPTPSPAINVNGSSTAATTTPSTTVQPTSTQQTPTSVTTPAEKQGFLATVWNGLLKFFGIR